MSTFSLVESGTSRAHFQLAKRLEDAVADQHRDRIVQEAVAVARRTLAAQPPSDAKTAADALLPVLHALHAYPHSPLTTESIDVSFALLPALQIVSLSTRWDHLLVGLGLLGYLVPSAQLRSPADSAIPAASHLPNPIDAQSPTTASDASHNIRLTAPTPSQEADGSSLLLLNTFRKHLIQGSQSKSRRSASTPHASTLALVTATLSSVAAGMPSGTSVLPSLATPLLRLTSHANAHVRKEALNAMWRCSTYEEEELMRDEGGAPGHSLREGGEMIQATIQIVKEMVASPFALPSSGEEQEQEAAIEEIRRRLESDPSVLRAALRIISFARDVKVLSAADAVALAVNVLQCLEWAPPRMNDGVAQGSSVAAATVSRLDGLRARSAARARSTVARDYDYHGLSSPWAVMAALDNIGTSLDAITAEDSRDLPSTQWRAIEQMVLRVYLRSSQGRDAALAMSVSAARCLGSLCKLRQRTASHKAQASHDGETAALWQGVSRHVKHQLASSNANRKLAAIRLLSALQPSGWAGPADEADAAATSRPFTLDDGEMATLLGFLGDRDEAVRRGALRLLDSVDGSLVELHLGGLEKALADLQSGADVVSLLERTLEAAYIRAHLSKLPLVSSAAEDGTERAQRGVGQLYAGAVCRALASAKFAAASASANAAMEAMAIDRVVKDLGGLPLSARLAAVSELVTTAARSTDTETLYGLAAAVVCEVEAADVNGLPSARDDVAAMLPSLVEMLVKADDGAVRDAVLAALARVAALTTVEDGAAAAVERDRLAARVRKVAAAAVVAFRKRAEKAAEILELHTDHHNHHHLLTLVSALAAPLQSPSDILATLLAADQQSGNVADPPSLSSNAARSDASTSHPPLSPDPLTASQSQARRGARATVRSLITSTTLEAPGGSAASFDSATSSSSSRAAPLRFGGYAAPSPPGSDLAAPRRSHRAPSRSTTASAIPPRAKRERDSHISALMSSSIARLVMGSDPEDGAGGDSTLPASPARGDMDATVLFSASTEGLDDHDAELPVIPARREAADAFAPTARAGEEPSFLDILHQCHNCDPWSDASLHPFVLDGVQIGFLRPSVVRACEDDIAHRRREGLPPILCMGRWQTQQREWVKAVTFDGAVSDLASRTAGMDAVTRRWRSLGLFPDPLDGWRDELYGIYGPPPAPSSRHDVLAFKMERSACALFGLATFGVHLTAFTPSYAIWVPRRAATKSTWPGFLDNSVAGGIVAGDAPWESVVRECGEEASLPAPYVEERLKSVGVLSYVYQTAGSGWIQPEVEYVYDLPVEEEMVLKPSDGEAEGFEKMSVEDVMRRMKRGEFKANCCLVLLDFFIRHSLLRPEEEASYRAIVAQLHTDLRLPGP